MSIQNYYLGCPIWANKDWAGEVYTKKAKPKDYLKQYAQVFNTIEGNHTFYGLPKFQSVLRWKTETPNNFKFCFKFPRTISHVYKLRNTQSELVQFFNILAPLAEQIGLFFLQLPPSFKKNGLKTLEQFLHTLPTDFKYTVEVRHLDFYDEADTEQRLNDLLQRFNINRALFDTQTLHQIQASRDEHVLIAQHKKPKMPPRLTATAQQPFLRFVGHPTVEPNVPRLTELAQTTAQWIQEGRTPFIFLHSPSGNDFYSPHICKHFHQLLQQALKDTPVSTGKMPVWPADREKDLPQQLSLF